MIAPRSRPASHPDTDIDCQQAAEADFQELIERMEAVGWSGETTARALLALSMAHIKARAGKAQVERAMRQARESVEGKAE